MNKQYEYEQNLRWSPDNFFEKWLFWHKHQHIGKSVVVFLKCLKEPKYADFWLHLQFNKGLFCHFGTTEVNKKWHFFLVLTKDSKNKEKILKVSSMGAQH